MSIILTSKGINDNIGYKLYQRALCDFDLNHRTLLVITIKKYGISNIVRYRFKELGYKNIMVVDTNDSHVLEDISFNDVYVGEGKVFEISELINNLKIEKIIRRSYFDGGNYMGSSAGAMIAGKDILCGLDFEKPVVPINNFDGLNLVEGCAVIPHYTKKELQRYIKNTPGIIDRYKKIYNVANDGVLVI